MGKLFSLIRCWLLDCHLSPWEVVLRPGLGDFLVGGGVRFNPNNASFEGVNFVAVFLH